MNDAVRALDISAPSLPSGRVAIEASAGTGKTFSLSVLVARYVAESALAPERLLLVTYTNEATRELRTRTRERCQEALVTLRTGAPLEAWMATMGDTGARAESIVRLEDFLARFDEVTITTIHGFCQAVLRRAGASSPAPDNPRVEASVSALVDQVITDLLAGSLSAAPAHLHRHDDVTAKEVATALNGLRKSVMAVLGNPGADILPAGHGSPLWTPDQAILGRKGLRNKDNALADTRHAERLADLVRRVVGEVRRRNNEAGILTYDDMIRLVAQSLGAGDDGVLPPLALDLASQFSMIMVDEFQDTDALQWQIFRAIHAAGGPSSTLITVGDPKQAIYRFRGADVGVYLAATADADETYSLGVNWRSDKPLLNGLERLFGGVSFDADGVATFEPVAHAPGRDGSALGAAPGAPAGLPGAPLEIRVIGDHPSLGADVNDAGAAIRNSSPAVVDLFFRDATNRIVELLDHATIDTGAAGEPPRRLTPGDVAVLVNGHTDADAMVAHLRNAGVPAVRLKTGSVLASTAAQQWQMLLGAVAHPGRITAVRTFALSWFSDLDEGDLLDDDGKVAELQRRCAELGERLARDGIVAFYLSLRNDPAFLAQVLGSADGERNITDLDHIAEMLASDPRLRKAGPSEVEAVLAALLEDPDAEAEEQKRRIETDRTAVTVMTRHASKGLQFPVVVLPTLAKNPGDNSKPWILPARLAPGEPSRRVIDIGSAFADASTWILAPDDTDHLEPLAVASRREAIAKDDLAHDARRLLYVAMTRAQHKLIAYWSTTYRNPRPPFGALLRAAVGVDALPTDDDALAAALAPLSADTDGDIAVQVISPTPPVARYVAPSAGSAHDAVRCAVVERDSESVVATGYGRWSYTGIVRRADGEKHHDTAQTRQLPGGDVDTTTRTHVDFAWHGMPAGARFGTAVHHILDSVDPGTATLDDMTIETRRAFAGWREDIDLDRLATLLHGCLGAHLGGVLGGLSLAQLGSANRLSELRFDFRLPQDGAFTLNEFADAALSGAPLPTALENHLNEMREGHRGDIPIAGYMTGSIDALFRVPGAQPTFVVSDYKTNLVHSDDDASPRLAYTQDRLEAEMARHGYFVQSLIYTVALHRYLRWRLPDYDYDRHVGGVSYLFLRGLGTETYQHDNASRPYGVHEWTPPRASVEALDRLFAGVGR